MTGRCRPPCCFVWQRPSHPLTSSRVSSALGTLVIMPGNLKERKKSLSSSSLSSSGSSSESLSSDDAEKERDLDRSRHVKWKNGKGIRKVSSAKGRPNVKDDR